MELNLKTKDYAGDAVSYKVAAKEFVYMEAKVITANVSIKVRNRHFSAGYCEIVFLCLGLCFEFIEF